MTSAVNTIQNWGVYKKKEKKTLRKRLQKAIQTLRAKLATLRTRKVKTAQKQALSRKIKTMLKTLRKSKNENTFNYRTLYPEMMTTPKATLTQRIQKSIQKAKKSLPTLKKKKHVEYIYNMY